ncbi:MAG TPA: hypothetical protein VHJ34_01985, partial [Actinomycetota bacterium]|nr:hypothetical protein [Actinomycetota bacterium]
MSADGLPDDVAAALVRGLGAYLRATPAPELPARLRRLRGFRPKSLQRHRDELLAAMDDDALRARVVEWLDDRPSLRTRDAELLRVASERAEGWSARLAAAVEPAPPPDDGGARDDDEAELLERERARTRRARADA